MDISTALTDLFGPPMSVHLVLSLLFSVAIAKICSNLFCSRTESPSHSRHNFTEASSVNFINRTQILKCNISHRRLFPAQHAFTYPCLSAGVPVRNPKSTWILSVDKDSWWERGWLHVTVKDHFGIEEREAKTISEALDVYLERQGLDPNKFPHVYLLTIPRFFNYTFSPASFWYLYTADYALHYVIAEVNNTFKERRLYLFSVQEHREGIFRQSVAKDFHVSPFNSRKGAYQLSTTSPERAANVSMKITLFSSKGHPKLVARWWSDVPPIDPTESSVLYLLWCLIGWSWTILITFPRIVYQAVLLARVRELHIWYRPEPRESAIPRKAIASERLVASILVQYLRFLVSMPWGGLHSIKFQSSAAPGCVISPNSACMEQVEIRNPPEHVEMRIHGPNFYRQLLHSRRLTDLLSYAMLHPSEENHTVWSNNPELLMSLLQEAEDRKYPDVCTRQPGRLSALVVGPLSVAWILHRLLVPPALGITGVYPNPGFPKERIGVLPRAEPRVALCSSPHPSKQCFLHTYVRNHCSTLVQVQYMAATLSLHWTTLIANAIGGE
ncbi:hypothetical protein F4777DRAFT_87329 [Nemania sp. FL0916]|nr:hypothetical protein F4777DRAFT_87329 [Nemania sp. FL0916]